MTTHLTTCRFCKEWQDDHTPDKCGKVHYATRHHAHYGCYLDAKGVQGLAKLSEWQIAEFPARVFRDRNISDAEIELAT